MAIAGQEANFSPAGQTIVPTAYMPFGMRLSAPADVTLYAVEWSVLEKLKGIDRPIQLGIGTTLLGVAGGYIPTGFASLRALWRQEPSPVDDVLLLMLWVGFLVSGGFLLVGALRGRSDANNILDEIKKRPTYRLLHHVTVAEDSPATPTGTAAAQPAPRKRSRRKAS